MSMAMGSKLGLEPGSWVEYLYDVGIGVLVGTAHSFYLVYKWFYVNVLVPVLNAFGFGLEKEKRVVGKSPEKTLKVIGVGYGRTGTYSLALALEELGFPCLHTQHLYEHAGILNMWTNEIFFPAVDSRTIMMGKPDLQVIADTGYQATTDLPMALYFEQVMEEYPDCKFVLTTREDSETWFESWDTLTKSITPPTLLGGAFFADVKRYEYYLRWLYSVINKDKTYFTAPFPLPDQNREASIASYEAHNKRVREVIPPDRLLEYSVKEGWEPLCEFLEIEECPQTPFPRSNSARSLRVQTFCALIIPLVLVLFCLFYLFAKGFHRATGMTVVQWTNWKSRELMHALQRLLIGDEKVACGGGGARRIPPTRRKLVRKES